MRKQTCIRVGIITLLTVSLFAAGIPFALATVRDRTEESPNSHSAAEPVQPKSSATFEKSEVVYANLATSGTPEAVYVVNRFDVTDAGTVADFGDYKTIQNLTDETELTHKKDAVTFETEQGTFFYQGNAAQNILPWDISIEYNLDGKPVTTDELIGASGDLAIHVETVHNEAINDAFYNSFMVQITFTLPGDVADDIHAQGTIVSPVIAEAGQDTTVAFAALPKHDGAFELTARVKDFHMPSVQIVALPYSMVLDMPDTDAMIDDMSTLADAVDRLSVGTSELASGIDRLTEGAQNLSLGTVEFGAGLNELSNSSGDLINASGQIEQVFDFLSSMFDDVDLSQIDRLKKLPEGMDKLASVLDQLAISVKEVQEGYKNAIDDLDRAIAELKNNAPTEEEIVSLQEYVKDEPKQAETVEKLLKAYKAAQGVADVYETGKPVFIRINNIFDTLVPVLEQQGGFVRSIAAELQSLIDSGALDRIPQLVGGMKQMLGQYGRFHDGLAQYASGVSMLALNYNQLQSGTVSLADGVSSLSDGAGILAGGMCELNTAVALIPETMREQIESMADEFDFPEFEPVSFMSFKNEHIAAVQFIMTTAALEKPEVKEEQQPEPELTLWDRFMALFS